MEIGSATGSSQNAWRPVQKSSSSRRRGAVPSPPDDGTWYKDAFHPAQILRRDWGHGRRAPQPDRIQELFEKRNDFEVFTLATLQQLLALLEIEVARAPSPLLHYQLATVLMQCMPTTESLQRSTQLLELGLIPGSELEAEIQIASREMLADLEAMLSSDNAPDGRVDHVNWGISNLCPVTCVGCYDIKSLWMLSTEKVKEVLSQLARAGTRTLTLSGGDPLLRNDIVEIVEHAHDVGISVGIDTVGYTLTREMALQLKGKVAYITVTLEGEDQETIEVFRKGKKDLFVHLKESLSILDEVEIPAKVNTSVYRANLDHLDAIADILDRHPSTRGWNWSLFQWFDSRADAKTRAKMSISDEEFDRATEGLQQRHPDLTIKAKPVAKRRALFFIGSNGEVYTFGRSRFISPIIIGDIKRQPIEQIAASPALWRVPRGESL